MLLELPNIRALSASLFERLPPSAARGAAGKDGDAHDARGAGHAGARGEDPALMAIRAASLLRSGEMDAAREAVERAAACLGLQLDAAGLDAMHRTLEPSPSPPTPPPTPPPAPPPAPLPAPPIGQTAPLLRVASVLWTHGREHALASRALELLLTARGATHADAPVTAARLALSRQRQGLLTEVRARQGSPRLAKARRPSRLMHSSPHTLPFPPHAQVGEVLARSVPRVHRLTAEGEAAERARAAEEAPAVVLRRLDEIRDTLSAPPSSKAPSRAIVSLSLSRLGLSSVPDALFGLCPLQRLDVSYNALEGLPEDVGRLRSLRELHASANNLAALPEALAALPQLFVLALQSNRFARVPDVALRCRRLRELKWGVQKVAPGVEHGTGGRRSDANEGGVGNCEIPMGEGTPAQPEAQQVSSDCF